MNPNPSLWDEVHARVDRLGQLVRTMPGDSVMEIPTAHSYVLGMFWRTVRLFEGVLILVRAELPEEAVILARSLFEDSVRLEQLAREPQLRDARIVSLANEAIIERRRLLQTGQRVGLDQYSDNTDALAELDAQQKNVQAYARRHNVQKFATFLSTSDAAKKLGRNPNYLWLFDLANGLVHGADTAWLFSRQKRDDVVGFYFKNADPSVRAGVLAFASNSLAKSAETASAIFDWPLPSEELKQLQQEIEALVET